MNNTPQNMEQILSRQISGFHQYCLAEPARLCYVSGNFCEMTGFSEEELLSETEDLYALRLHPADRENYTAFLQKLAEKEQTLTEEYRFIRKSGEILFVGDKLEEKYKDLPVTDYGHNLIIPSFVDMHLHAPQYPMLCMGMDMELIDWLSAYV